MERYGRCCDTPWRCCGTPRCAGAQRTGNAGTGTLFSRPGPALSPARIASRGAGRIMPENLPGHRKSSRPGRKMPENLPAPGKNSRPGRKMPENPPALGNNSRPGRKTQENLPGHWENRGVREPSGRGMQVPGPFFLGARTCPFPGADRRPRRKQRGGCESARMERTSARSMWFVVMDNASVLGKYLSISVLCDQGCLKSSSPD